MGAAGKRHIVRHIHRDGNRNTTVGRETEISLRYSVICIIFNMKFLSNMIPFDFDLRIKFDRDFILKSDSKKKVSISGEIIFKIKSLSRV